MVAFASSSEALARACGIPLPPGVAWKPDPGPQEALLSCPVEDVFFGGARGGGKSDGIVADWVGHQDRRGGHARGLLMRRTYPQLEELAARCSELFKRLGAVYKADARTWIFPNGSELKLRYLDTDADADEYQGHEYTWIGIDEAGNFPSPAPIDKLQACLRSKWGIPCVMRLTGNPRGVGHTWLKRRYVLPSKPYRPWFDRARQIQRVFIPSKMTDNRHLDQRTYKRKLHAVGTPALVKAWLDGNWDDAEDGGLFHVSKIRQLDEPAERLIARYGLRPVQYWDLATREKQLFKVDPSDDPDYSACVTAARGSDNRFHVLHAWRGQVNPVDFLKQAHALQSRFRCPVKAEKGAIFNCLNGVLPMMNDILGRDLFIQPIGKGAVDKVAHSMPAQMLVNSGNLYVPSDCGDWLDWWQEELRIFPTTGAGVHDDGVDALSYAAEDLKRMPRGQPPAVHPNIPGKMSMDDAEAMMARQKEREAGDTGETRRWW